MKTKKFFTYILAALIMFGTLSLQGISSVISSAENVDNGVMRDNMTAQQYADDMGLGINLGNTMEAYWLDRNRETSGSSTGPGKTPQDFEKCWGAVVTTQEIIDGMKNAGFKTVRIPVYWGNMMEEDGTYTINPQYIGRVKEIVDYCRKAGLYAVINMHHYDEFVIRHYTTFGTLDECAETIKHLWTQIAEYFKGYSDYLIFEGFNEYLGGGPYKLDENGNILTDSKDNPTILDLPKDEAYNWTNTLNQAFVSAVRATGGNNAYRILIASGYWTNIDNTTSDQFKMPTDTTNDRLMVSVHYVDNGSYWSNQIGNENWLSYSKSQLELLKKAFTSKNIPVFIGETTGGYDGHFASNAFVKNSTEAVNYMLRLIKSYGFVPVIWDTNGGFYSRTEYKINLQSNADMINTLSKELADGTFVAPEQPTRPPTTKSTTSSATTTMLTQATSSTSTVAEIKVPTQAKLTKLRVSSKKKKKINVVWGKVSGAKGYEVQVSKFSNFKKLILKKTTSKKKLVIKNKKIKSKKVYYVRVRAYTTYKDVNGVTKRVNSRWNRVLRRVKVK